MPQVRGPPALQAEHRLPVWLLQGRLLRPQGARWPRLLRCCIAALLCHLSGGWEEQPTAAAGHRRQRLRPPWHRPQGALERRAGRALAPPTTRSCSPCPPLQPTSCMNGAKDGYESDIDCGGQDCLGCENGKTCKASSDCASKHCKGGRCVIQVGGATGSAERLPWRMLGAEDSQVGRRGTARVLLAKAAGQSLLLVPLPPCRPQFPSCTDGTLNGDEADVDCGGTCPARCPNDKTCSADSACQSGYCNEGDCIDGICSQHGICAPKVRRRPTPEEKQDGRQVHTLTTRSRSPCPTPAATLLYRWRQERLRNLHGLRRQGVPRLRTREELQGVVRLRKQELQGRRLRPSGAAVVWVGKRWWWWVAPDCPSPQPTQHNDQTEIKPPAATHLHRRHHERRRVGRGLRCAAAVGLFTACHSFEAPAGGFCPAGLTVGHRFIAGGPCPPCVTKLTCGGVDRNCKSGFCLQSQCISGTCKTSVCASLVSVQFACGGKRSLSK